MSDRTVVISIFRIVRADCLSAMRCWLANTLYISGRIGLDPATGAAPGSVDAELDLLFMAFRRCCVRLEWPWMISVWVQVYSPDISLWQQFNAAYVKFFSREFPGARVFRLGTTVNEWTI